MSIHDEKRQIAFCEEIIEKGLSVRQAELGFSHYGKRRAKTKKNNISADASIRNLEEMLQHALGTKVKIYPGKKRGKIEIEYYSLEDLDRVLRLLNINE